MKNYFIILLLMLITNSMAVIVEYNSLTPAQQAYALPDLQGKVNCTEDFLNGNLAHNGARVLPEMAEGWPLSYPSSNCLKGAIYTNMDEDEELEILFGVGMKIVALNIDGSNVPGFPQVLDYYVWGSPACGDIDGDMEDEIVCCSRNSTTGNEGELYAFEKNGNSLEGFPLALAGGGTMNACLADLDSDEDLEILVNVRNNPNGWLYVFQGDGSVFTGFPQQLDTIPGSGVSAGDLNGDDIPEIVCLSYESLFAFDVNGNLLPGFPVSEPGYNYSYSQPILVDIDNDFQREIVYGGCSGGGAVFAVNYDGTYVDGWPQYTDQWVFANPAFADLDDDGDLEIIIGDQVSSGTPVDHIYAWHADGSAVTGFPAGPTNAIYAQAGIADLDNDLEPEIMIDDNNFGNGYECYNCDGSHCEDFPLPAGSGWDATTMQSTPVFADLDLDGFLEIMGSGTGFTTWLVELCLWDTDSAWNEDLAYMPIDGCNICHTGLYPQNLQITSPSNCTANCFDYNDVLLQWEMEDAGQSGFQIYCNNEIHTTAIPPEIREIELYGFATGDYEFYLTALYNDIESEPSPADSVYIDLLPPQNLTYENICSGVILYWNVPPMSRNLSFYNIYRDDVLIDSVADTFFTDEALPVDTYEYYLTAVYSDSLESSAGNTVTVNVVSTHPDLINSLLHHIENYPNPFNPSTVISFELQKQLSLHIAVYNLKGQKIKDFGSSSYKAGNNKINWNGLTDNGLPAAAGAYLLQLQGENVSWQHKILLLK